MKYIIVPAEALHLVNFSQVLQTSPESLRFSSDEKYFLLKYKGDHPDFCYDISNDAIGLKEYSHEEILKELQKPEWTSQS